MNWVAHLKYLKSILKKFDFPLTSTKKNFIHYFCHSIKYLIRVEINKQVYYIDNENEMVKKNL